MITEFPALALAHGKLEKLIAVMKTDLAIYKVFDVNRYSDFMNVYRQCYPYENIRKDVDVWVGYVDAIPVCCATAKINRFKGILYDLGTIPEYRNNGYGEDMTRHVLAYMRDVGCSTAYCTLNVASSAIAPKIVSNGIEGVDFWINEVRKEVSHG